MTSRLTAEVLLALGILAGVAIIFDGISCARDLDSKQFLTECIKSHSPAECRLAIDERRAALVDP